MLQEMYVPIYNYFDGSDALISTIVSSAIMIGVFWFVGGLFLLADLMGPGWIRRYKVQQDKNATIDKVKLKKALKTIAFNSLVVNVICAAYPMYVIQKWRGVSFNINDVPSTPRIILDIFVSGCVQDVVFYYSHRLCHLSWFYKSIHKKHHEWTAPIGIISSYAHPLEYLTGNLLSVLVGPVVMRSHIVTFFIWYTVANVVTIVHHSGYHLPLLPSPQFHDYHHLTFSWNFGTLGWVDWLHGTDKQFYESVEGDRHHNLWSVEPMRQKIPVKLNNKQQHSKQG